ncbi:hypothetical protein [Apilactobacillus quenuiae]|uniref:hypothetical protein n=1 Tax=Apilactobacillus quenuiae TaxID=2008377 RepID=UPI000D019D84|nr:hypothetical protein [Apilactobacillus quenuiae]
MNKKIIFKDILIDVLLLILPLWMIIYGLIELAKGSLFHPDVFVLFGILIIGPISIFRVFFYQSKIKENNGWKHSMFYQKFLLIFYITFLIISILFWLMFLEIIPPITW